MGKIKYTIVVATADEKKAGTDEDVWIRLVGNLRPTHAFHLDNQSNNFERNRIDIFDIWDEDIGDLQRIEIKMTPSGEKDVEDYWTKNVQDMTGISIPKTGKSPMWKPDFIRVYRDAELMDWQPVFHGGEVYGNSEKGRHIKSFWWTGKVIFRRWIAANEAPWKNDIIQDELEFDKGYPFGPRPKTIFDIMNEHNNL
ncbi:MAG: PLAT/LH2 domain-containing protein [Cyclobacteriaceae bacterium]